MQKLKIGLLLNDYQITSWSFLMIQQIVNSDYAELTLIIKNTTVLPKRFLHTKLKMSFSNALYSLFIRFDKKISKTTPDAFELINIDSLIQNIATLEVLPISTKLSDRFSENDIKQINSYDLDVIIRLGFKILRGDILNTSKHGIWSFHHGDNKLNRGGPAGAWEVLQSWTQTGVILQILTEELDGGIVIERSYSQTDPISITRNNNSLFWKALSMIPRNLKKLHALGGEKFMSDINLKNTNPNFYYNKLFVIPTNFPLIFLVIKLFAKKFAEKIYNIFFINQWILMYSIGKSESIAKSFFRFKKILPPKDRFWADPFVIFKNDLYYIFIEELVYKTNKGHISVMTIDSKGNTSKPIKILDKDYHLSYPFVFENNNEYYMIPESSGNNSIDLYKSTEFPYKWELVNVLMKDVVAVDTTIHFYNNKYWMFCNMKQNKGSSKLDELFIFYADDFKSNVWYPHAQNPVVSDIRKARPAGKIFKYKNNYYRPSQNSSKYYGRGMHIAKIITLNENEYIEESIQNIYSNWDNRLISTHTLNSDGKLTIIDGQYRRSKF